MPDKSRDYTAQVVWGSLLALAAATVISTTAQAAPPGFCHKYAKAAVHQNHRNIIKGCGYSGWRWHAWYQGHYKWCRSTSKGFARSERVNRFILLKQCW
ncbi:MAG: hypothetical protein K0U74_10480 [Alphaproteobacteria bacterium]|nr:hypothetical protein [Alphaproteobacteria bacterium]